MRNIDYLVIGQGLAGSVLAWELSQKGATVQVIDRPGEDTSSMKAAGIYNPITGRRMVKTWLADELFPTLETYYQGIEKKLATKFLYPKPIYRPFYTYEELNDWATKQDEPGFNRYINDVRNMPAGISGLNDTLGGIKLKNSGHLDVPSLLSNIRNYFRNKGIYASEVFQYDQMKINEDAIVYKDCQASKIIFCEGPEVSNNPFWKLPFKPVKGEILEIKAPISDDLILNRGVFILPTKGIFKVGSTYDHSHLDYIPTEQGIKNIKERLNKLYSGPYEEVRRSAGIRPATYDRRPLIGMHPKYRRIGIFNGFGSKGVSLVPYFGRQFVNFLFGKGRLLPEVDVSRTLG